ncbi:MAG: ubiquinol-cytochrome c reductase iron-sulfur subunit [Desulfuromusa sp.]
MWKYLTPKSLSQKNKVLLEVAKADIPVEGALYYRDLRLAIIREKGEIYALSLICTHLGCTVNVTPQQMICPCHGSVFDRHGVALKGPAELPLPRFNLKIKGDSVQVLS